MSALTTTTYVELRKMVDTRGGQWLLLATGGITALAIGAVALWGEGTDQTLRSYLSVAALPLGIFLPILGIMSATQEWSQRTGLVTFVLEPRRSRVILAKTVAAVILGGFLLAVAAVAAAVATAATAGPGASSGTGTWRLDARMAGGLLLAMALYLVQGVGFGMAFLSTPLAIVSSFVLPAAWTTMSVLVPKVEELGAWLDLGRVSAPLTAGTMEGQDWAHLLAGTAFWVGLPFAIGTWRVLTREVR